MIQFNKESFDKALGEGKLMMVDFWADWCGPCRMLAPVIDQLAERYEGKVVSGKVNVDDEQELAIRYGVMSIPTVIFFKDGKEIDRKVGVMPGDAFAQTLEKNLSARVRRAARAPNGARAVFRLGKKSLNRGFCVRIPPPEELTPEEK